MVTVALDAQGSARARPYVEKAGATFTTLIDEEGTLAGVFGFKAVPNVVFADEVGVIRFTRFGGFNILRAEDARLAERFAASEALGEVERQASKPNAFREPAALERFRRGLNLYRQGKVQQALDEWREAAAAEPDNWIVRKQIWAVENPERFYEGAVDYDWQKEQIAQGR